MTIPSSRMVSFFVVMVAAITFGLGTAVANAISDRVFVLKAEDGNMLEVALGEMAQQQAVTPEVKQFGQQLARDHILASNQLLEIAKKDDIQVPGDMDRAEYQVVLHFQGLKGRDFDTAFMKHMVDDHKDDIAMFEQMANEGTNPDLKDYAQQALPTLREHLRMAQDIYNKIKD